MIHTEEPQYAELSKCQAFHVQGEILRDYPRKGERQMLNSLNGSGFPPQSLPRVDLADRNVESSSNIFYCFIALGDDAHTLGNGFGCDRMVSSNHDNLKRKQTAMKALPVLQSSTAQRQGPLHSGSHVSFVLLVSPRTEQV